MSYIRNFFWSIAIAAASGTAAYAETFVFTAIPDQDETRLRARFDKVAEYLSARLEVDVNYIPVKSYAAAVTAFKNDQVQLAWFGGLSGVRARQRVPGSGRLVANVIQVLAHDLHHFTATELGA